MVRRLIPIYLTLLLCAAAVLGQSSPQFIAYYAFSAGGKITIQQPASGSRNTELVGGFYQCNSAATVTESRDGTAATSTTLTPFSLSGGGAPTATAWSDSNVGAGTTLFSFSCAAAEKNTLDLNGIALLGDGTSKNFSLAVSTGTGVLAISWRQR